MMWIYKLVKDLILRKYIIYKLGCMYILLKYVILIRCIFIMEENVIMNFCGNRLVDV